MHIKPRTPFNHPNLMTGCPELSPPMTSSARKSIPRRAGRARIASFSIKRGYESRSIRELYKRRSRPSCADRAMRDNDTAVLPALPVRGPRSCQNRIISVARGEGLIVCLISERCFFEINRWFRLFEGKKYMISTVWRSKHMISTAWRRHT